MLELYTTLARSQVEENELILEENVDGMDFVAGVLFADADDEGASTYVTLRVGYYLPGAFLHNAVLQWCTEISSPSMLH